MTPIRSTARGRSALRRGLAPLAVLAIALVGARTQEVDPDGDPSLRPYLQAPAPDSIWVSWRTEPGAAPVVLWGRDDGALDRRTPGTTHILSDVGYPANYAYHTAQLTGLRPDTAYRYQVRTGARRSAIFRFRTPPVHGADDIVRFLVLGDHQVLASDRYERLVRAASERIQQRFGRRLEDAIDVVLNLGDQVDVGTLEHYELLHFRQSRLISPFLPIMPIVGNHELYGTLGLEAYRDHFVLGGTSYAVPSGTEHYYAYQIGRVVVLATSTEHPSAAQREWARDVIDAADADADVDWIVTLGHKPNIAEQYVGDVSTWMRDQIFPLLEASPKAVLFAGGHHHLYARGQRPDAPLYHMISGGAAWDQRWGMSTEIDFGEVQKTIDYWPFQIVEFFPSERRMRVESYAIGHALVSPGTELIDVFERTFGEPTPQAPSVVPLSSGPLELPLAILSTPFDQPAGHLLHSTHFQVAPTADFVDVELDSRRAFENLYGTTGPPHYDPIDLNAGVDLLRLDVPSESIVNGEHFVRVRHRDRNLEWSDWSDPERFEVTGSVNGFPELALDRESYDVGAPIQVSYAFGPNLPDDWIGLYRSNQTPGGSPSQTWSYVQGESGQVTFTLPTAGTYFAAFFRDNGYTEIADRVPFYVGPVPEVGVTPLFQPSNATVDVTFTNGPALTDDWIGVYRLGEVPGSVGSTVWRYVSGTAGTLPFSGLADGYYFATYLLQDGYEEPGERAYFAVGQAPASVSTDAASYAVGDTIQVTLSGGPGGLADRLGLFVASTSEPVATVPVGGATGGAFLIDTTGLTPGDHYVALLVSASETEVSNRALCTISP